MLAGFPLDFEKRRRTFPPILLYLLQNHLQLIMAESIQEVSGLVRMLTAPETCVLGKQFYITSVDFGRAAARPNGDAVCLLRRKLR